MAHHVADLYGEPEDSLGVEYGRVRIFGLVVRHFVLSDFTGTRIELADVRGEVPGVPDVAVAIGNKTVRTVVVSLQGILLEISCCGVEASQLADHLLGEPQ